MRLISVESVKILHTSDWHIGRTFHQHSTADALASVLDALVDLVRDHDVDVVVVAGDVFDSSTPSAAAVQELDRVLLELQRTGVTVIVTSGNHDSPARLGAKAAFAREAGVHVITRPEDHATPVTVHDQHGPVHFYGIAYLEPALIRHHWPEQRLTNQATAVGFALDNIRADLAEREGDRSVVLAHTFVSGAEGESCESERGITVGGVDRVPVSAFDQITYAALGHIHGRHTLAPHVRYSGAPLHLSFSEQGKPRGAWLVELDAAGLGEVTWLDLPVPRPLATLTGTLDELLSDATLAPYEQHWVRAVLTDVSRPSDPMRRLQRRFPHCALLEFRPSRIDDTAPADPRRLATLTDQQVMAEFLAFVRNGEGPTEAEQQVLDQLVGEVAAAEVSR